MIENSTGNIKVFECNDTIAKLIYDKMKFLPIKSYYSNEKKENINTFVLAKVLKNFLIEQHIEVQNG